MPQFNSGLNKPWGFGNNNHRIFKNPYQQTTHTGMDVNILPEQIIPQKHAANLLNRMAYKASKKYDKVSKLGITKPIAYPTITPKPSKRPDNSEVLFLPGEQSTGCNEKVAKGGKYSSCNKIIKFALN